MATKPAYITRESSAQRKSFPGFPIRAISFMRSLERNNKREWFQPRKSIFDEQIRKPLEELVGCINNHFAESAPRYVTPVAKSIFRIYRDTRFSNDKRPYKTRVAAVFHLQTMSKTSGGCFYFHFTAKELLIAAGVYMPEREELLAIRNLLAERHAEFRELTGSRTLKKLMGELQGDQLSRVPKGFDKDHPAESLLRRRQWYMEAVLSPELVSTPSMLSEILTRFRAVTPVIEFLNQPFIKRNAPRKLPFMAF
jgi:uncharacterized protein (TIGR02453 family)